MHGFALARLLPRGGGLRPPLRGLRRRADIPHESITLDVLAGLVEESARPTPRRARPSGRYHREPARPGVRGHAPQVGELAHQAPRNAAHVEVRPGIVEQLAAGEGQAAVLSRGRAVAGIS
jgi:hypothetical protein